MSSYQTCLSKCTANYAASTTRVTWNGREYIVAPMVLIREGVLNGSSGPLFYPGSELAKNVDAWNGMPIVLNHPREGSARRPFVLLKDGMGFVFNARYRQRKLTAEGYFDVEATRQVSPDILTALQSGRTLELSTGLFTDSEEARAGATFNGKAYTAIARNYRPDHLAILPTAKGACSRTDGCGVLVNCSHEVDQEPLDMAAMQFGRSSTSEGVRYSDGNPDVLEMPVMDFKQPQGKATRASHRASQLANNPDVLEMPRMF